MSGGRAKAKRKSAKKAAANSAPTLDGARLEEFVIGNVRCFAGEQRVPIRPITLLVGENSTGKTTFLGCYRVIHQLTETPHLQEMSEHPWMERSAPSFNVRPFRMGAFRDIVNHDALRASSPGFQLGAKVPYRAISAARSFPEKTPVPETRKYESGQVDLIYSFEEGNSGIAVHKASIVFSDTGDRLDFSLGKHLYDGIHSLAVDDQRHLNEVDVGGFSRAIYAYEIANALSRSHSLKPPGKMKHIHSILDRQIYQNAASDATWRQLTLVNDSAVFPFAPVRSEVARTYNYGGGAESDPEGHHTPEFLARLSRVNKREWGSLRKSLIKFGEESGLFSDINVKGTSKQVGAPFEIHVKVRGEQSNLLDVGYGVGQIYPLLARIMYASQQKHRAAFLLQEPEAHLHPQAQAALASFFAKSARDDDHTFIIETHGDSIIDRVRVCVRRGEIAPEDVVLLYFDPDKKTGAVKIHPIHLDELGNVLDAPVGYRQFFLDETDRLLGFKE